MGVMDNGEHSGNRMTDTKLTTVCAQMFALEESCRPSLGIQKLG